MPYIRLRHLFQYSFPTLSPTTLIHSTQNFSPLPEHIRNPFILPWHYGQECLSSLFLCPSSLTANAPFSKAFPDSPSMPIRTLLLYLRYVTYLYEHWLHKTTIKKLWGLKTSRQNKTNELMQRPRMDLRDLLVYNTRGSNRRRNPSSH